MMNPGNSERESLPSFEHESLRFHRVVRAILIGLVALVACGPSKTIDPRCTIEAEGPHYDWLVESVNGSTIWQEYFDRASAVITIREKSS